MRADGIHSEDWLSYTRKVQRAFRRRFGIGPKIFNLSPHRSGTQSAATFFTKIGFPSQHWPGVEFERACEPFLRPFDLSGVWLQYQPMLKINNSFHDVPVPFLYRQILSDFPESLYFIIRREPAKWVRSVRQHTEDRELTVLEKFQYWTMCGNHFDHLKYYTDAELERSYASFISAVADEMSVRKTKFHIFELESPDLASSIAAFCGVTRSIPPFERIDIVAAGRKRTRINMSGGH